MTDEQRNQEGAEEEIEDLEAPASAQGDVVGGQTEGCHGGASWICPKPSVIDKCVAPTCKATKVVVREA